MQWIYMAFLTAIALAAADFFVKLAAGKVSNSLGLLLYGSCTFLAGLTWVLWERYQGNSLFAQPVGVVAGIGVGLAFTGVTIGLYATFGSGAPISSASPAIRVGGLLMASIAGLVLLHEPLTWRYVLGIFLTLSGIALIVLR